MMTSTKSKHLYPPPALFQGPSSRNASHVSLSGLQIPGTSLSSNTDKITSPITNTSQRTPLTRQRSTRLGSRSNFDGPGDAAPGASLPWAPLPRQQVSEGQKQADRTDALWAEMQSTLEEVELSAVNGNHVFGPSHSKALDELRMAQIALAQAWARSEADEAVDTADKESRSAKAIGSLASEGKSALEGTEGAKSASGSARPTSSGGAEKAGQKLEEETKADILLARKRRVANDKYFDRVNGGVLDVVAKLEEVASAMRAVERESRDIWRDSDSAATGSVQS